MKHLLPKWFIEVWEEAWARHVERIEAFEQKMEGRYERN